VHVPSYVNSCKCALFVGRFVAAISVRAVRLSDVCAASRTYACADTNEEIKARRKGRTLSRSLRVSYQHAIVAHPSRAGRC